jgi:hypothetical protein
MHKSWIQFPETAISAKEIEIGYLQIHAMFLFVVLHVSIPLPLSND